jgi:exodeoxyribonuclease-5
MTFEEIIVGRNATRKAVNARVRTLLGRTDDLPIKGDRLVCLRNDHEQGLLNGAIWEAEEVYDNTGDIYFDALLKDGSDFLACCIHKHHFLDKTGAPMVHWMRREAQEFDFGYCLTCHKSQGSEWPSVLVFDESDSFGPDKFKWLYTAVTRASERVVLVRK